MRIVELHRRRSFAGSTPPAPTAYNLFIGNVSGAIYTDALLAAKLSISVGMISDFTIIGSDIKCIITGSYAIPNDAFIWNYLPCTYYTDSDYLVNAIGDRVFYNTSAFENKIADFRNVTSVGDQAFATTKANAYLLKNAINVLQRAFSNCVNSNTFYIPSCTNLGGSALYNEVFVSIKPGAIIYAHPSLATNNAGGVDGDLAYAITQGAIVRYVSNYTAPNPITTLSIGAVYSSALQVNFTAPTGSVNAIDYYECYVDGVYKSNIKASGDYIYGLTIGTSYSIELKPVDIFYNKSTSNIVFQTTAAYNSFTDTDANAYISASSLTGLEKESAYILFTELKAKSLYTKTHAIYPFKGTTATQHKFNAKNPLDTDAAFRLTFTGAATFSNNGYQLNGSSYANTRLTPSVTQSLNNHGVTVVCGTNNTTTNGDTYEFGSEQSASQSYLLSLKNNNTDFKKAIRMNASYLTSGGVNEAKGIFTSVKQSSTIAKLFRNNTLLINGGAGGTLPSIPHFIGAVNLNGTPYGYSAQRIQMAIIHEGFSNAEIETLYLIIDLSESIAGRKNW